MFKRRTTNMVYIQTINGTWICSPELEGQDFWSNFAKVVLSFFGFGMVLVRVLGFMFKTGAVHTSRYMMEVEHKG